MKPLGLSILINGEVFYVIEDSKYSIKDYKPEFNSRVITIESHDLAKIKMSYSYFMKLYKQQNKGLNNDNRN